MKQVSYFLSPDKPCAEPSGVWKVGDRVMVYPFKTDWGGEQPTLKELQGLGAGSIDGTLRQYCVFVRRCHSQTFQ